MVTTRIRIALLGAGGFATDAVRPSLSLSLLLVVTEVGAGLARASTHSVCAP